MKRVNLWIFWVECVIIDIFFKLKLEKIVENFYFFLYSLKKWKNYYVIIWILVYFWERIECKLEIMVSKMVEGVLFFVCGFDLIKNDFKVWIFMYFILFISFFNFYIIVFVFFVEVGFF